MIADQEIEAIALDVAKAQFSEAKVRGVEIKSGFDSQEDEILQLTISLADGALDAASRDAVLNTLVHIRRRLEAAGETRRPTISYDEPEIDPLEEPEAIGGPRR